jgi:hypothetical protein
MLDAKVAKIGFRGVIDPAEIDPYIINSLFKETVCKAFRHIFFSSVSHHMY